MASNRIVSSTIVRPEVDPREDDRRKRSFPVDIPGPVARRSSSSSNISSRLGNASTTTSEFGTGGGVHYDVDSTAASSVSTSTGTIGATASMVLEMNSAATTTDDNNAPPVVHEASGESITDSNDRTKRARLSHNPQEDTKRGRRMMGMILGTLSQFKKETSSAGVGGGSGSGGAGAGTGESAGPTSRELLEARVREKLRKEHDLNEELRQKRQGEREARSRQQLVDRQATRKSGATNRDQDKWSNGFLLTETRPRLRYMPKMMNETTRRKFEAQRDQRRISGKNALAESTSASTSTVMGAVAAEATASLSDKAADARTLSGASDPAVSIDLDVEDIVMDVVVDATAQAANAKTDATTSSPPEASTTAKTSVEAAESVELISIRLV
ncbi:hypothetical protein BGZ99_009057 [Dissophora globulifera]|uniref:Pinin/SDK/MemA protein domain-containing protein n=1 Tax=Dissophora globulifera TaxID=979702 RepID=A0A9P6RVM1_9FUNG|nr:hypothetical protein BGZ99_009057 [Dissophora globulifera]